MDEDKSAGVQKLWQKDTTAAEWVARFTVGEDYRWDTLLIPYDIEGTKAHAWALEHMGLLSREERGAIESSLERLAHLIDQGEVRVRLEDEDCHTVIEAHLTRELEDAGRKIHAGRSRNDQVLVALRLFIRDQLGVILRRTATITGALCDLAETNERLLMPGYTHQQRAMPSTVGLWAAGYAELLAGDLQLIADARRAANVSPWGSAAGYGVPYLNMPRDEVARRLGFDGVQRHVTAVQLSRGKHETAVLHALVQFAATINRLSSDLVLYNTSEFGFVKLPAEFCTGSSIMPQKQNPDVLELARANYHRLLAEMQVLQTLPANLSSGYHRDLQLTKEAVMRGIILASDLAHGIEKLVPGIAFDGEALKRAMSKELFATHSALVKVRDGVPFRDAYRLAADELDTLEIPSASDAINSYVVKGYPGRLDLDSIRQKAASIAESA